MLLLWKMMILSVINLRKLKVSFYSSAGYCEDDNVPHKIFWIERKPPPNWSVEQKARRPIATHWCIALSSCISGLEYCRESTSRVKCTKVQTMHQMENLQIHLDNWTIGLDNTCNLSNPKVQAIWIQGWQNVHASLEMHFSHTIGHILLWLTHNFKLRINLWCTYQRSSRDWDLCPGPGRGLKSLTGSRPRWLSTFNPIKEFLSNSLPGHYCLVPACTSRPEISGVPDT